MTMTMTIINSLKSKPMASKRSSNPVPLVSGPTNIRKGRTLRFVTRAGSYERAKVVIITEGNGCKWYDPKGREYLDMGGGMGIGVNALGHGDPDRLKLLIHQSSHLQVEFAKLLVTNSFADRVFFFNFGTEANEAAIKFSSKFQTFSNSDDVKKQPLEFIVFSNCFHGRRSPFDPLMPGFTILEYGDIEAATQLILKGNIAAVFVEPIQDQGGINIATHHFLRSLRTACDQAGSILIFDEVQCGFGRTGHLWAHQAYDDVFPDIMTLSNSLAGGIPIAAVLVTEKIAAAINHGDHGSTLPGSPLVYYTAIAVIDKISDPAFLLTVSDKGKYMKKLLTQKLGGNSHVKEIRGQGLIIGIELDVPARPLVDACLNSGLIVLTAGKGNVVRLVPPLIITEQELEQAANVLTNCLHVLG